MHQDDLVIYDPHTYPNNELKMVSASPADREISLTGAETERTTLQTQRWAIYLFLGAFALIANNQNRSAIAQLRLTI